MDHARRCPPHSWLTLTTRDPNMPGEVFYAGTNAVFKRLRRQYGPVEYYGALEHTTGRHAKDGQRRLHGHYLLRFGRGRPRAGVGALARDTWRTSLRNAAKEYEAWRTDYQELATGAREAVGAVAYISAYAAKKEQTAPEEWKGRRIRVSRDYFDGPIEVLRAGAVASLIAEASLFDVALDAVDAQLLIDGERRNAEELRRETLRRRKARRTLKQEARWLALQMPDSGHIVSTSLSDTRDYRTDQLLLLGR